MKKNQPEGSKDPHTLTEDEKEHDRLLRGKIAKQVDALSVQELRDIAFLLAVFNTDPKFDIQVLVNSMQVVDERMIDGALALYGLVYANYERPHYTQMFENWRRAFRASKIGDSFEEDLLKKGKKS
jgi:hypothetical protein